MFHAYAGKDFSCVVAPTQGQQHLRKSAKSIVADTSLISLNQSVNGRSGFINVRSNALSLEDVVLDLYRASQKPCEFGFVTKKGARLLLPPSTMYSEPSDDYFTAGRFDKRKADINNKVYDVLTANLSQRQAVGQSSLPQNLGSLTIGHIKHFASNAKNIIKIEVERNRLKEETKEILENYLNSSYSFISRLWLNDSLGDVKKSQSRLPTRRYYNSPEQLQEALDKTFQKNRTLIVRTRNHSEFNHYISRETGLRGKKLSFSPFSVVVGDLKEISAVYDMYKAKAFSKFSQALARNFCEASIFWDKGVYLPELISEFLGHRQWISPRSNSMWNLENIGAYLAQQYSTGKDVTVGIIDTGCDYNHPEIRNRFSKVLGHDFITSTDDPMDQHGHGTHVAGTTAGQKVGIATSCTLYALRVLGADGSGSLSNVLQAVYWAIDNRLKVINLSLGSPQPSDIERQAYQEAKQAGLLICAAAGNEGYGPSYPAAYDAVMSVAAVDKYNNHADFSNIWKDNNISAPGVDVYSCLPNSSYAAWSGTSMATPHLSGVCALACELSKTIDEDSFVTSLNKTAQPLGEWDVFGAGLLRADALVMELMKNRR